MFQALLRACRAMDGFERPWYVAGGWAIDLHLDHVTRTHSDIDIVVARDGQESLRRHFSGWELRYAVPGPRGTLHPWPGGRRLEPPIHELHAERKEPSPARLEFLLHDQSGELWTYRRDPAVRRSIDTIGFRSPHGIPYLAPVIVLLYKAKEPRPIDERDFEAVLPRLDEDDRRWLARALERCHPGHDWTARLRAQAPNPPGVAGEDAPPPPRK